MAERNEMGALLGGHDAGDHGGLEDGSLLCQKVIAMQTGEQIGAEDDPAGGAGAAVRDGLAADIDHAGPAAFVEMGEFAHRGNT
jgi:hypothetical protein